MQRVLVVLGFLVLAALLSVDIYVRLKPPKWASAPAPSPSPAASAAPTPMGAETPRPQDAAEVIAPLASPTPAVVAAAPPPMGPAGKKPPAGPGKPKPANPPAAASPGPDSRAETTSGREAVSGQSFRTGETLVETKESRSTEVPAGFDPGGVAVKVAPKFAARVEFDIQPKRLKAGDPYVVKVYLRNDGKKAIKVRELWIGSSLNGSRSESTLTPKMKEVPAQQVALLAELPSVWKADVNAWSMEVAVRSGHGDTYKNTVTWR